MRPINRAAHDPTHPPANATPSRISADTNKRASSAIRSMDMANLGQEDLLSPGAQTEPPEDAGPVKTLLGGENSPADFVLRLFASVRSSAMAREGSGTTMPGLRSTVFENVRPVDVGRRAIQARAVGVVDGVGHREAVDVNRGPETGKNADAAPDAEGSVGFHDVVA